MKPVLVDSNVILDVVTGDKRWYGWSSATLSKLADDRVLVINPVIYAEVSIGFDSIEALDEAVAGGIFPARPDTMGSGVFSGKMFSAIPEGRWDSRLTTSRLFHRSACGSHGDGVADEGCWPLP